MVRKAYISFLPQKFVRQRKEPAPTRHILLDDCEQLPADFDFSSFHDEAELLCLSDIRCLLFSWQRKRQQFGIRNQFEQLQYSRRGIVRKRQ